MGLPYGPVAGGFSLLLGTAHWSGGETNTGADLGPPMMVGAGFTVKSGGVWGGAITLMRALDPLIKSGAGFASSGTRGFAGVIPLMNIAGVKDFVPLMM